MAQRICRGAGVNRQALTVQAVTNPVRPEEKMTLDGAFLSQLSREIGADGVAEMIRIFAEDAPVRMAAIRRGVTAGAWQTVRREAHAIAGAAITVGLPRLSEAAGVVQNTAERTEVDDTIVETFAAVLRDSMRLATTWADAHDGLGRSG